MQLMDNPSSLPKISVVIPAYNNAATLGECIAALEPRSEVLEVIVVDDASTDGTAAVAAEMDVRVLRLERNSGPAAARNLGAREAKGELVFFVDADVVLRPGMIPRMRQNFSTHPEYAAVFGSYDAMPRARSVVSQYRNLMHHFYHQQGRAEASTFWAGCGAVRRSVFLSLGGFDERRFPYPSIEDIELGYRLRNAGYRILLDKSLQATHLKKWSFWTVVRTDIFHRALPWSRLIVESQNLPEDLNVTLKQRISAGLVLLGAAAVPLSFLWWKALGFAAALFLIVAVLNRALYGFFLHQGGVWFAAVCVPLHFLYYLYSDICFLYVWCRFHLKRAPGNR